MTDSQSSNEQQQNLPQPLAEQAAEVVAVRRGMFGGNGTSGDTSGYGRLVRRIEFPGQSPHPYGGYFDEVENELFGALEERDLAPELAVEKAVVHRGQLVMARAGHQRQPA